MKIELNRKDAVKLLGKMEHRISTRRRDVSWPLQVRYKGRWLNVCRTDLMDDITTGSGNIRSIKDAIRKCNYGARINSKDGYVAVIDQLTDG